MAESSGKLPIDSGWAWMIVFGYFNSIFYMVGIAKSFGILLEEFVDYFDIPVALGALIMGVSGGVYTVAAPVCVALGQHYGQRVVVMTGGMVGALGICLSSFLFNIEYVIFTFGALFGIGNSCIFGNGLVIIGNYFRKWRGLANGLGLSGASIGQFAMAPLLTFLIKTFSLKGALLIIGGLYLNVVVCGALYRPPTFYTEPRNRKKKEEQVKLLVVEGKEGNGDGELTDENVDTAKDAAGEISTELILNGELQNEKLAAKGLVMGSVDSLHSVAVVHENPPSKTSPSHEERKKSTCRQFLSHLIDFSVLRNYVVIFYTVVSFLLFLGHFNFILFMPATASSRGVSKYMKAWLVSITGIADLFGRILIGLVGDFGVLARYKLMAISCLICSVAIFLFVFAQAYWVMAIFVGFYGFFGGCYVSINNPVLIDLVGLQTMPKALGVVLFIQGLGAAFGQPLLGAVRDLLGSYDVVHCINSVAMLLGAIILLIYPLVKKSEEKRSEKLAQRVEQDVEIRI